MKTLLLLRHARPSHTSPTGRDFDRPLVEEGRADALTVGQTLRRKNLAPEVIVSSPAVRARETAGIVADAAQLAAPRFDERLFNATTEQLLAVIAEVEETTATTLLVVAHNPGLADVISLLTGAGARVPPGTLARIDLDIEAWSDLRADSRARLAFALAPGEE